MIAVFHRSLLVLILLLLETSVTVAAERTCEQLFRPTKSRKISHQTKSSDNSNESIPTPSSITFYQNHTADSPLTSLRRTEVEVLFRIRDRILGKSSQNSPGITRLESSDEVLLVETILRRPWEASETLTYQQWENRLAIPSFKNLAYKVAHTRMKYDRHTNFDELVQAAMTGLVSGIREYQTNSIFMPSTYIYRHAKDEMTEVARRSSPGIDIASTNEAYQRLMVLLKIRSKLRLSLNHEPSNDEIAAAFNSSNQVTIAAQSVTNILSRYEVMRSMRIALLSEPKTSETIDESNQRDIDAIDFLETENTTPIENYSAKQRSSQIAIALASLAPREQTLIGLRMGITVVREDKEVYTLSYSDPLTLVEVGERMGITRERVRQLEIRAFRKLRHPSRSLEKLYHEIE